MLKTISFLFIFLISFAVNCQSVPNDYEELWQKVEKYEGTGLPKSALQIVENILEKAKRENNSPQIVKSLLFQSKYILTVEEGARLKILADFNRTIAASGFPTENILEGILANMYWQYFQANRYRFYQRTKTKEKVDSTDFRTWDLQTLMNEVNLHFQRSLENGDKAKQLKLKDFAAILSEAPGSKKLRPTLFDFLGHLALDFYKNPENQIAEPVYKFEVDRKDFLETAEDFAKLEINTKDSLSLSVQALKIYQGLIRFHLKDKSQAALADVNIARLKYVQSLATFPNSQKIFLKTLKAERENSQDSEAGALYTYEIASLYYDMGKEYNSKTNPEPRWKIKEAFELCEACISEFRKTKGAEKCAVLREMILKKTLEIFTEEFLPVQKNAKMLVSYKNIDSLNFELYALSEKEIDSFQKYRSKLGKIGFMEKLKLIKHWVSNLRNKGDFREHSTEILLPKMENGHYLIYATTADEEKKITAFEMLQVTDLAVVEKTGNGKVIFQIVDRNNGKP
ncbi:MAG TPA: alpha-2-macroglobulin, partial [Flavobacteriaceae bacterium]|nr:alpha-2-macroglobulin [Flavobacteriaceae bacterium]